jgi:hypothetical protein
MLLSVKLIHIIICPVLYNRGFEIHTPAGMKKSRPPMDKAVLIRKVSEDFKKSYNIN